MFTYNELARMLFKGDIRALCFHFRLGVFGMNGLAICERHFLAEVLEEYRVRPLDKLVTEGVQKRETEVKLSGLSFICYPDNLGSLLSVVWTSP